MDFETIIGLEVHVQLLTKSKMFCRCSAEYASAPPNTHVCPVCMALPGVLPVINRQAVEYTIMTALALNCTVSENTKFDRKNYPYPDLMKGYQISQYDSPIGQHGWLSFEVNGEEKKAGITRVHLEEDVAKLLHRSSPDGEDYSLVDINRSGVPLMEVVGEPDLHSPEEARQYLIKLRSILQYLGVSTGNMEEGSFRCDANISIRPVNDSDTMAKVEVKNMNSFKAVYQALEYEASRQRKATAEGKKLHQETRGWVEAEGKTVSQRSKEYAHDYRYFPEPDLPPLVINREWVDEIKARLPELPEARRDRFIAEYGLPLYDAGLLTGSKDFAEKFEEYLGAMPTGQPIKERAKMVSNWLLGDASGIINANSVDITQFSKRVSPKQFGELMDLVVQGSITGTTAKPVLEEMFKTGRSADDIVSEQGLSQISDTSEIEETILEVIKSNDRPVADYKAGKEQALKFLVGQVMKATKGRSNPQMVNELLKKKLA
ncbi:Asp-tRNA(Asn)/Glu-tRNA(Gln) amidotransferase subunit GatB [Chloroflexota bacterium]